MAILSEKDLFNYADQKLNLHYKSNEQFKLEMGVLYQYYKEKLFNLLNESDKLQVDTELFTALKSQIFNGYFIGLEIINKSELQNEWLSQSEGVIAQQIPDLLRSSANYNLEEVITNEPLRRLISWLIIEYEGIYELLLDISLNSTCLGVKWAFLDEAEKRGLIKQKPQINGFLGFVDEITFITPDTYIACEIPSEHGEVWNIISSRFHGLDKVGEINILKYNQFVDTATYHMSIGIKSSISISEQQKIIDMLASRLIIRKEIEREQLVLKASSIDEFYLINNPTIVY